MKNNYPLLLSATIAVVILLLLSSCGTRKTDISYQKQSKDSITIENHYTQATKTVLMDVFTAKPIDALKPMVINGKEYFNATIVYDKSKLDNFEVSQGEKVIRIETEKEVKNKESEKTDYTILFASMFFIAFLFIFLWFKLPNVKVLLK